MRNSLLNITILLLVPLFVITSVTSAMGYSWCFGSDGHVDIKYRTDNRCCSSIPQIGSPPVKPSSDTLIRTEQCAPCLDLPAQKGEAVFTKRLKKILPLLVVAAVPVSSPEISLKSADLTIGNLTSQPPPWVSQAILVHRTVVLLN